MFLGFIPGVYRGLWCTGGGALEMSRHRSQLRGPLWVHSEGSKQERGPPVRLHSGLPNRNDTGGYEVVIKREGGHVW